MKKEQVNAILLEQKRKRKITSYLFLIIIIIICSLSLLFLYFSKTKDYYVSYKEASNLDYKVYLKENDFFETNYVEENKQYIASLIDHINANFNYKLSIENMAIDYQYQYRIEAFVNVLDNGTKSSIFSKKIDLVPEKLMYSHKESTVEINENINIDYNYYNDLIKKFITVYELNETTSTLEINMYVRVLGNCEDIEDAETNNVITLSIPLTTKTVGIDMNYNVLGDNATNVMICNDNDSSVIIYLILSILIFIVGIILIVVLIKYVVKSRTAETIYHRELRKILNNYKSYIQKINNELDLRGYKVLVVDTFTDMLEIRDTIQEPILMIENKQKTGVFFLIPSKTKILYTYSIKVDDIKNKMMEEL